MSKNTKLKEKTMADLPLDEESKQPLVKQAKEQSVKVTQENAGVLTVHLLAQIHGRLGYIIKLLEEKK